MPTTLAAIILFSFFNAMGKTPPTDTSNGIPHPHLDKIKSQIIEDKKITPEAWQKAREFYLQHHKKYKLADHSIGVADFSKPSSKKRLALVNLKSGLIDYYKVSHGKGSDPNHDLNLDLFSGRPGSYSTPQGFHKMTSTYMGKHGLSLKMQGLEASNKTSEARAIVLHGADYVSWNHTGRSLGCPAVEKRHTIKIIERLKNGALFFHYNGATKKYAH